MAFSERARYRHRDRNGVLNIFEIHEDGYEGGLLTLDGNFDRGVGILDVRRMDIRQESIPLILYAMLELYPMIKGATEQQLLDDIFDADDDRFIIIWKRAGVPMWTGSIVNNIYNEEESPYPWTSTIAAKDIERLKGIDYPLRSSRETIIETIADILSYLPYSLDITTRTNWTHEEITSGTDYLAQIYHDVDALRRISVSELEDDEPITCYDALQRICDAHRLYVKQEFNSWHFCQFSAWKNRLSVQTTVYNPDGTVKTATGLEAPVLTIGTEASSVKVKKIGTNTYGIQAIKRVKTKFDHRNKATNIQFPDTFRLNDDDAISRAFSQFYDGDGSQSLQISGSIVAQHDNTITESSFLLRIEVDGYYWDITNEEWTTTLVTNSIELTDTILSGGKIMFETSLNISTLNIPALAGNTITITAFVARDESTSTFSDYTDCINFDLTVNNALVAEGQSDAIDYQLTQDGAYSRVLVLPDVWFGAGPTFQSTSALRYSSSDSDIASEGWGVIGEANDKKFMEVYLREVLDPFRTKRKGRNAAINGVIRTDLLSTYREREYIWAGGTLQFAEGNYTSAEMIEIKIETSVNDIYKQTPRYN